MSTLVFVAFLLAFFALNAIGGAIHQVFAKRYWDRQPQESHCRFGKRLLGDRWYTAGKVRALCAKHSFAPADRITADEPLLGRLFDDDSICDLLEDLELRFRLVFLPNEYQSIRTVRDVVELVAAKTRAP